MKFLYFSFIYLFWIFCLSTYLSPHLLFKTEDINEFFVYFLI